MEVERLCEIGVLKKVNRSEWAAPSFVILKKDGTTRFINDFWELKQMDSTEAASHSQHPTHAAEPRRVSMRD